MSVREQQFGRELIHLIHELVSSRNQRGEVVLACDHIYLAERARPAG